jgi:hypothetical protein
MQCGVFNAPCHLGGEEAKQADVDDRSTIRRLNGRRNWGVHKGDRAWVLGQAVSGGRAISEWVFRKVRRESQIAGESRKTDSFPTFCRRPPLARGGGGDRRGQAGLRSFQEMGF